MKRFINIQIGARLDYAIPIILNNADLLEAFYTDIYIDKRLEYWLKFFLSNLAENNAFSRLINRCIPSQLKDKTISFDWELLKYLIKQKLIGDNILLRYKALCEFNQDFGMAAMQKDIGQATHVYSMFGEGGIFLEFAKEKGLKIVIDTYLSPATHRIVQEEKKKFSGMEENIPYEIIQKDYAWFNKICETADTFIAPSLFVKKGLQEFNVSEERIFIVPYGVHDLWFYLVNKPIKGRILFVGTAEIRKGIHILGIAAQQLSLQNYEFRIAGGVSETIRSHPLMDKLSFLGRIPRSQIQQEYTQADIFVLPSLAEGSAGAIYEALASGLPVITTESAGSVLRDGIEGFIVPESDPDALAECIKGLVENRDLRNRMGKAARERAKDYTWDNYGLRLLSVLKSI